MDAMQEIAFSLDTTGKCCPMPMVETNQAIKALAVGEELEIIATDIGTRKDIPSWCERTGQTLLASSEHGKELRFYVRKNR